MTQFGKTMLEHWLLDPSITYLNHGTVGATPKRVLDAQREIRDAIEKQPSRFMLRDLGHHVGIPAKAKPLMRVAADQAAAQMGAKGDDLVFVDNATTGCNAVLRSLKLSPGDVILVTDLAYGAITYGATFVAKQFGAEVRTVTMPYPATASQMADAIINAIDSRTKLVIIDHITSESALLMPIAEIAARCHEKGVMVLVDAAHAPGAIPLDIESYGVDWYTGNFHKWGWAPRSSAFLWAAPNRQEGLHPVVISWGLDKGFALEFDWVGTRDPSPFLTVPKAFEYMAEFGTEAVQAYNHQLVWEAAHWVCKQLGTKFEITEDMIGVMATIPLPESLGATREDGFRLRDALLFEDKIEVQLHGWRGRLWARISAQIYNDMTDFETLTTAIQKRM